MRECGSAGCEGWRSVGGGGGWRVGGVVAEAAGEGSELTAKASGIGLLTVTGV